MRIAASLCAALGAFAALVIVQACTPLKERNPVPAEYTEEAAVANFARIRYWGDADPEISAEEIADFRQQKISDPERSGKPTEYLAISGGGQNGAFGAGLLNGWTASGTRPQFTIVSGISTGALTAPFAFLGSRYDKTLEDIYTAHDTDDILRKRSVVSLLTSDSLADTGPLESLIAKYMTREVMAEIAAEREKGRALLIGTTNLDANRPVIWRIGAIATSDDPGALELIRQIMLASASIPGVFPPVYIEVEANGQPYDEMHVDGGATSQVFLYPAQFDYPRYATQMGMKLEGQTLYVIRNARLQPGWQPVKPQLIPIITRSVESLTSNQGLGDLYRIYLKARQDGFDFNLAAIPGEFDLEPNEAFDKTYMRALYDTGYALGKSGYPWQKMPPGFVAPKNDTGRAASFQ